MNKYDDIINLKHYVSKTRKHMSLESRAAQFAPFKALNGYEEAIVDSSKVYDKKLEYDEELQSELNNKLDILENNIKSKPKITITYFTYDSKNEEGKYITNTFNLRRIDKVQGKLLMTDGSAIDFNLLIDIEGEIFNNSKEYF